MFPNESDADDRRRRLTQNLWCVEPRRMMRGRTFLTGAALAAALIVSAGCGRAATKADSGSECVWQQLPGSQRDALLAAYSQQGSDGLGSVAISDPTIRTVARVCGAKEMDPAHFRTASVAIAGAAMRHGAEHGLAGNGVQRRTLDSAWQVASTQRTALFAAIENPDHSPDAAKALFLTIADLTRRAGGTVPADRNAMSDPTFRLYADYFTGRALEEKSSSDLKR